MSPIVLITGTSKGIGKSLAEHYLDVGWAVIGCSRSPATIEHSAYTHYSLDATDEAAVVRMVRQIARGHGRIDALINNAGIAAMNALTTTPSASALRVMNTNFQSTFLCTREVAKVMMRVRSGRIVNFSTVAVPLRLEGEAVYAASKSAVETLTRVSARELGGFNVTVNAIGPTPVETDLIKAVPKAKIDALLARQSIARLGTFADISNVTDFFLSPASAFVTGQVIYLGGVG